MVLKLFLRWFFDIRATALTETVVLFPVALTLLMGCYDLGQGIILNQKTVGASQIMGDLIARNRSVDMAEISDIVNGGELALEPYETTTFGYDIVSVEFGSGGSVDVLWRVTNNMLPNNASLESLDGLGGEGEGLVIVTTSYTYHPFFTNFLVGDIHMNEVAFLRGRRSATISCSDCPSG